MMAVVGGALVTGTSAYGLDSIDHVVLCKPKTIE
jgi:hypothetical protein